jgi:hypothetical protein
VAASLGFGQRGAQLLHAGVEIGGNLRLLAVIGFIVVIGVLRNRTRRMGYARDALALVDALEVDAGDQVSADALRRLLRPLSLHSSTIA